MILKQGDCLELMKEIPSKSVDMILCDLPYGTTHCKWDSVIPFDGLWKEYKRIIKDNGAIVLFSQMPFGADLILSNKKMFRYEWIWEKDAAAGFLNANKMPLRCHENILVFYKKLPIYNPQFTIGKPYHMSTHSHSDNYGNLICVATDNPDGKRYPRDVQRFNKPKANSSDKVSHPTQKPVSLLEYLIKTYTNDGETVLDNCMGSGSTGVACVNTGRDFIGFELGENYFNIAKNRIDEAEKLRYKKSEAKNE